MITENARLFGVAAYPGGRNLFQRTFAAAAETVDPDAIFMLFDFQPKEIAPHIEAMKTLDLRGLYLTGRHRMAATGLVDYLSDEAHGSGAINAITFGDETARGHNTEATALIELLSEHRDLFARRSAVVIGGGVMARAAAYAVIRHFRVPHVTIANRTLQQAQLLKNSIGTGKGEMKIEAHELFPPDLAQLLAEARLLINATPIGSGTTKEESPISLPEIFSPNQVIVDTVYENADTPLLVDARKAGATVIDGRELLKRQLRHAFELFTEKPFPEGEEVQIDFGSTVS